MDSLSGAILASHTVPTTHDSERGVSDGILDAFTRIINDDSSNIRLDDIDLVAHSTTQAINALLENDTYPVGIVAMGVGPTKKDVIKRTRLGTGRGSGRGRDSVQENIHTFHEFLDTSHLITEQEVSSAISRMRDAGARCIVATEMFGVDDPSNEEFVSEQSAAAGLPCTSSHEVSGTYGLEIRTLTAAVNASIMPKTMQVADFVESAMSRAGVQSPLLVMRGDGGVTNMETFRSKPIMTVLSGPAASVAGALLHLRVTNGVFIEVGGTSTNICVIKGGRPEIRYVTIKDHPTCIRSMDVRIVGVAGGSMVSIHKNRVHRVGSRSAHIAGMTYSCYAEPSEIKSGKIAMIRPKTNDDGEYAVIQCRNGRTYAITNTCAANALDRIPDGDYSKCKDSESAKESMRKLGDYMGMSYSEAAMSIILTATQEITNTVSRILKEYKMDPRSTQIIGGGGGASVLVPEVAKNMGMQYAKAPYAEVISSIGVASSMLQDESEVAMTDPTPDVIAAAHKKAHSEIVAKGAVPESVSVDSSYIPDKGILRITAVGSVEMSEPSAAGFGNDDKGGESGQTSNTTRPLAAFGLDDALERASEISGMDRNLINLGFESDHYMVLVCHSTKRRLFSKKNRHRIIILDRRGRIKLDIHNGVMFQGGKLAVIEELDAYLESRHSGIAPQVYLIGDSKMLDFSGLTSPSHVLGAVQGELDDDAKAAVLIGT